MSFQTTQCFVLAFMFMASVSCVASAATEDSGAPTAGPGRLRGTNSVDNEATPLSVHIKNSANHTVTIASSCSEKPTLKPGEALNLMVSKSQVVFVVPEGTEWNCQTGCSDCFYFIANLTGEGALEGSVGYGLGMEVISNASNIDGLDNATDIPEPNTPDDHLNRSVSGVELIPNGRFDGAKDAASCTRLFCDINLPVAAGKQGLSFEIHGNAISQDLESAWFIAGGHWGHHWGGYRRWGGYHRRYGRRCFWRWGHYTCAWCGY